MIAWNMWEAWVYICRVVLGFLLLQSALLIVYWAAGLSLPRLKRKRARFAGYYVSDATQIDPLHHKCSICGDPSSQFCSVCMFWACTRHLHFRAGIAACERCHDERRK